jgi:hypothetical protein
MDASTSQDQPSPQPESSEAEFDSVWQFAQQRLKNLWTQPEVRLETALTLGLLLLLFAPALPGWWQRWTLLGSLQTYSILFLPLLIFWIWINRRRLALPELDAVRRTFHARKSSGKRLSEREEISLSVINALREERSFSFNRPFWPLAVGCALTAFAYWVREPLLTYLAFILVLIGLLTYRFSTQMLRLAAFPLLFLGLMLPVPGVILDWVHDRLQVLLFGLTHDVLLNTNVDAKMTMHVEGNPLSINAYNLFADHTGLGLPEGWLALLLMIWVLSLIRARFRLKLGAVAVGFVWLVFLLVLRMLALCWMGMLDQEITAFLEPLTRLLIVLLGIGGQILILRVFKCRKFQNWVRI